MCCCGKPTRNDEPGYRWQPDDAPTVRGVDAPALAAGDVLLYDEPGRCGGIDSHSHHFRVVSQGTYKGGTLYALVRHGGGDERHELGEARRFGFMASLDSDARYWLLCELYHARKHETRAAVEKETARWRQAAAEHRIKTRKRRGRDMVDVWIELTPQEFAA